MICDSLCAAGIIYCCKHVLYGVLVSRSFHCEHQDPTTLKRLNHRPACWLGLVCLTSDTFAFAMAARDVWSGRNLMYEYTGTVQQCLDDHQMFYVLQVRTINTQAVFQCSFLFSLTHLSPPQTAPGLISSYSQCPFSCGVFGFAKKVEGVGIDVLFVGSFFLAWQRDNVARCMRPVIPDAVLYHRLALRYQ